MVYTTLSPNEMEDMCTMCMRAAVPRVRNIQQWIQLSWLAKSIAEGTKPNPYGDFFPKKRVVEPSAASKYS